MGCEASWTWWWWLGWRRGWGGGGPSSSASVPLSSTGARAGTEHAQQGARTGLPATSLATQRGGGGWGVREQGTGGWRRSEHLFENTLCWMSPLDTGWGPSVRPILTSERSILEVMALCGLWPCGARSGVEDRAGWAGQEGVRPANYLSPDTIQLSLLWTHQLLHTLPKDICTWLSFPPTNKTITIHGKTRITALQHILRCNTTTCPQGPPTWLIAQLWNNGKLCLQNSRQSSEKRSKQCPDV